MSRYKSNYFSDPVSLSQIRCHCGCNKDNLDTMVLKFLDKIRKEVGRPVNINSGCRCKIHDLNIYLGKLKRRLDARTLTRDKYKELVRLEKDKKRTSSHIKGLAVDIRVTGTRERFEILQAIFQFASPYIARIGIGESFIHFDIDPDKVQDVIWLY